MTPSVCADAGAGAAIVCSNRESNTPLTLSFDGRTVEGQQKIVFVNRRLRTDISVQSTRLATPNFIQYIFRIVSSFFAVVIPFAHGMITFFIIRCWRCSIINLNDTQWQICDPNTEFRARKIAVIHSTGCGEPNRWQQQRRTMSWRTMKICYISTVSVGFGDE